MCRNRYIGALLNISTIVVLTNRRETTVYNVQRNFYLF